MPSISPRDARDRRNAVLSLIEAVKAHDLS